MGGNTVSKHDKFIRLVNELKKLGERYKIALSNASFRIDDMAHYINRMKDIKYIGCDINHFYLLATDRRGIKILYRFDTSIESFDDFTTGHIIHMSILYEQKNMIIIQYYDCRRVTYISFQNFNISGFDCELFSDKCKFICNKSSEELCLFDCTRYIEKFPRFIHCDNPYIWGSARYGKNIAKYKYSICTSLDMDDINDSNTKEKIYELLLNMFGTSFRAIENDLEFISMLIKCLCEIFMFIFGDNYADLTLEKFYNDMDNSILWKECETVKHVENVLRNGLILDYEPLPILVLRAIVYEHSLLLFRKVTQ